MITGLGRWGGLWGWGGGVVGWRGCERVVVRGWVRLRWGSEWVGGGGCGGGRVGTGVSFVGGARLVVGVVGCGGGGGCVGILLEVGKREGGCSSFQETWDDSRGSLFSMAMDRSADGRSGGTVPGAAGPSRGACSRADPRAPGPQCGDARHARAGRIVRFSGAKPPCAPPPWRRGDVCTSERPTGGGIRHADCTTNGFSGNCYKGPGLCSPIRPA